MITGTFLLMCPINHDQIHALFSSDAIVYICIFGVVNIKEMVYVQLYINLLGG